MHFSTKPVPDDMSTNELGKMLRQMQTAQLSHPVPVLRAREIDRWASTQDYQGLLEKRSLLSNADSKGGWRNW
jgi:hypothetical protein